MYNSLNTNKYKLPTPERPGDKQIPECCNVI